MPEINSIKLWLRAVRLPFFTASAIPVILSAALAAWLQQDINWGFFLLSFGGVVFLQAATNLVSDYYDFIKGVDKPETFGSSSSRVLVDGLIEPKAVLVVGSSLFALGLASGLFVIFNRGPLLLIIALSGLFCGYAYSGKPFGLKYKGLGDILVFLGMGVLLVAGSFLALTGSLPAIAIFTSLPIACLVTAILHANNLRDIRDDKKAGIRTLAMVVGIKGAQAEYYALVSAAYVLVAIGILNGILPVLSWIIFISLPLVIRNIRLVSSAQKEQPQIVANADILTAQLHLVFGVLFILSFILASL